MESDATLLEEELSAVGAILGEDCEIDTGARKLHAWIPSKSASPPPYQLILRFGTEYPSAQPPQLQVQASQLPDGVIERLEDELYDLFLPGEVCIFNMCELLKERYEESWGMQQEDENSKADAEPETAWQETETKNQQSADQQRIAAIIVTGEPYIERKSTFQNGKIARATHNMSAYRIRVPDKDAFLQDCDDDGEAAAGSRLLRLLQVTKAEGVCVVVSRWFGGVHLGPSRFSVINNTARKLLVAEGYISDGASGKTRGRG